MRHPLRMREVQIGDVVEFEELSRVRGTVIRYSEHTHRGYLKTKHGTEIFFTDANVRLITPNEPPLMLPPCREEKRVGSSTLMRI